MRRACSVIAVHYLRAAITSLECAGGWKEQGDGWMNTHPMMSFPIILRLQGWLLCFSSGHVFICNQQKSKKEEIQSLNKKVSVKQKQGVNIYPLPSSFVVLYLLTFTDPLGLPSTWTSPTTEQKPFVNNAKSHLAGTDKAGCCVLECLNPTHSHVVRSSLPWRGLRPPPPDSGECQKAIRSLPTD